MIQIDDETKTNGEIMLNKYKREIIKNCIKLIKITSSMTQHM